MMTLQSILKSCACSEKFCRGRDGNHWSYYQVTSYHAKNNGDKLYCGVDSDGYDWSVIVHPDGSIENTNGFLGEQAKARDWQFYDDDAFNRLCRAVNDCEASADDRREMKKWLNAVNGLAHDMNQYSILLILLWMLGRSFPRKILLNGNPRILCHAGSTTSDDHSVKIEAEAKKR